MGGYYNENDQWVNIADEPVYKSDGAGGFVYNPNNSLGMDDYAGISTKKTSSSGIGIGYDPSTGSFNPSVTSATPDVNQWGGIGTDYGPYAPSTGGGSASTNNPPVYLPNSSPSPSNGPYDDLGLYGDSGTSDWDNATHNAYYQGMLELERKKAELENELAWASDANTKEQLRQQLTQILAQAEQFKQSFGLEQQAQDWTQNYQQQQLDQQQSQFDQTFGQNAYEFSKQFGLSQQQQDWLQNYQQQQLNQNQQSQDWTQNYQQQQLNQSGNQQTIDQNNYLAQLAAKPINWIQYNQSAGIPTVSQPFMQGLGGQPTGTVIGGQQYIPQPTQGTTIDKRSSDLGLFSPQPYYGQPISGTGAKVDNQNTGFGTFSPQPVPFNSQPASSSPASITNGYYTAPSTSVKPVSSSNIVGQPNALNLQQLTTPSMQYYNRMTPTEQQLYQGYQQALTGDSAEDTQYKLWQRAAPSGGSNLTYLR